MRGEWHKYSNKRQGRCDPKPTNIKLNGRIVNNRKGIIDYVYEENRTKIEMRHFVNVNVFVLKKDGQTSPIVPRRGYSIIQKWKTRPHALKVHGDMCDVEIDDVFASGTKRIFL